MEQHDLSGNGQKTLKFYFLWLVALGMLTQGGLLRADYPHGINSSGGGIFYNSTHDMPRLEAACFPPSDTIPEHSRDVVAIGNFGLQPTAEGYGEPYSFEETSANFAGGTGTEADPWQIETAEDLDHVRQYLGEAHQDKHFKQIADISLGESPWNKGEGWVPLGSSENPFFGYFDGNGHEVMNMVIDRHTGAYQGLFGWNNGNIVNLGVVNASVTDHGSRAGILAGLNDLGFIENCYTSGTIQSSHEDGRIGGLTGWNNSTIEDSYSTASVTSDGMLVGGLIGANSEGFVINCYAEGDVHTETIQAGGLVGTNQAGGLITGCYATGRVSGTAFIGGLVGSNVSGSSIINSHSTGSVNGAERVGGLAGIHYAGSIIEGCYSRGEVFAGENWAGGLVGLCLDNATISESFSASDVYAEGYSAGGLCGSIESNSTIQNTYATGSVSGIHYTGGLAGWADSSQIINAYATGHVLSEYGMYAGGLTGGGSETDIVHSFWNTETSGQITNDGGEGKTSSEMLSRATFADWDFDTTWGIEEGESYPYLVWQEEPGTHNFPEELPSVIRVPSMFPTIQEGIDRAGQGNTVLVADGVYTGRGNIFLSFKGKDIVLKSENGPEQCIIDYHEGPEERAVFLFMHGETRAGVMEGFTVINGNVAIYIENASPTIRNNVITNNASGILCGTGSSPLILHNNIIKNAGMGIVCENASPEIKRNLISQNGGSRFSSVMTTYYDRYQRPDKTYIKGSSEHGGIAAFNMSSPDIQNNLIIHNRGMHAGGIYSDSTSTALIANNHILENASIKGGSVFVEHASSKIVNNLIAYAGSSESTAGLSRWYKDHLFMHFVYDGAKLDYVTYYFGFVNYGEPCEVSLSGCAGLGGSVWAEMGERFWVTVRSEVDQFGHGGGLKANVNSDAGNFTINQRVGQFEACNAVTSKDVVSFGISEGRAGAGITVADHVDLPLIAHNNMFGNSGANYAYSTSGGIKEGAFDLTGTDGNISQDPHLDPVTYELLAASPCIDAGTTDVAGVDLDDVDFLGHARIRDGHGDGHAVVDIGAFEYQGTSVTYCIISAAPDHESHGAVSGDGQYAQNEEVTLTATPATGYHFVSWTEDGEVVSDNPEYTFTAEEDRNLVAHFAINTYLITATAGENGSISPAGDTEVEHGNKLALTITPDEGFRIAFIIIDGAEIDLAADTNWVAESGQYTFMDVTESHTIEVVFIVKSYAVICTPNNENHGAVTGGGEYDHFDQVTLTATPATGYHFVSWTEDGEVVSDNPEYSFTAEEDRNLVAHFAINTYLVTATASENGSISPAGDTEVEHGASLVFTIVPDEGFRIAFIIIDDVEIDLSNDPNWDAENGQYIFSDVTETHTIEVGFEVATALAEAETRQQLTVYPNPAKEELWVAFHHQGDAAVDVVLLNIHGQVVQQVSISAPGPVRHRMPTHDLTPGVYLLTIRGGEVFPVKKVVVEN